MNETQDEVEPHALVGAYVLDALPGDERHFFERHLAVCADCRVEVRELSAVAAALGAAAGEQPPAELRGRVLDAVGQTPQVRGTVAQPPVVAQRRRSRWLAVAAAILAVAVLGLAGLLLQTTAQVDRLEERVASTDPEMVAVLSAADARLVTLDGPEGVNARFVWSAARGEGVMVAEGLDAAPSGHTYALWLIDAQGPHLAGRLDPADGGAASAVVTGPVDAAQFGVTLEPDGPIEQPTGDILIAGALT